MPQADDADVANPCAECGGSCCSFRAIGIHFSSLDDGERYDSHFLDGDHIDQLVFEDGTVPEMDWFVTTDPDGNRRMSFECNHLTDDGKCGAYDKRPGMCRAFECEALDPDTDTTLDEFLAEFARPANFPADWDITEVTDRVRSILERRSDEEDWPIHGETWGFDQAGDGDTDTEG